MKINNLNFIIVFILLFYFFFNYILFLNSEGLKSFLMGADSYSYYNPAINLFNEGKLIFSDGNYMSNNTPLYSLLIYSFFYLSLSNAYILIIICQIILLIVSSFIFISTFKLINQNLKIILFILIIFNPNFLISAHLCQTEILYTFFFITSFYYLIKISEKFKIKYLIYCSIFISLATLTRPIGLYIFYSYIIIIFIIIILYYKYLITKYLQILFFILPFVLFTSIWEYRNYLLFGEFFLSSNKGYYSYDNLVQFIKITENISLNEAIKKTNNFYQNFQYKIDKTMCLNELRNIKCIDYLYNGFLKYILNAELILNLKALFFSLANTYLTGGATNYTNYLGIHDNSNIQIILNNKLKGAFTIKNFINASDINYLLILFITTFYAIIFRFFAILGLIYLFINKKYINLFIIIIIISSYTVLFLYVGNSRFRVPIEPILTYLGFCGMILLANKKNT